MRYLKEYIIRDLSKKMVFLGGPRQCGKTALAHDILKDAEHGLYLNWDDLDQKKAIRNRVWHDSDKLIVLDEIHKWKIWKNFIKGTYDNQKKMHQFLVTGSARLDDYRRGGDSLMGRYHYWRLHPFSMSEHPADLAKNEVLERLLKVGGFPEPFLENDEREARRWRKDRYDRIIKDDIRDLENIGNVQQLALLLELLRERVGGEIVYANLAADVGVSPVTIKKWIELLERMYVLFIVRPFTAKLARAIQKVPKAYFFDTGDVHGDMGARFENQVACELVKRLHFLEDRDGYRYQLYYVRDKDKREVDFAITKDGVLIELIEVKVGDEQISPSLRYMTTKLKPLKSTQIVYGLSKPYTHGGIQVVAPLQYFSGLEVTPY